MSKDCTLAPTAWGKSLPLLQMTGNGGHREYRPIEKNHKQETDQTVLIYHHEMAHQND